MVESMGRPNRDQGITNPDAPPPPVLTLPPVLLPIAVVLDEESLALAGQRLVELGAQAQAVALRLTDQLRAAVTAAIAEGVEEALAGLEPAAGEDAAPDPGSAPATEADPAGPEDLERFQDRWTAMERMGRQQ
jgi:hypothetical protein